MPVTRIIGPGGEPEDDEPQILRHLDDLLALPRHRQRAALLALGLPAAIQRRLGDMLADQTSAEDFLETPILPRPSAQLPEPGARIGVYRLERLIGAGGMGVVYLASRDDGIYDQQVAIKLVQPASSLAGPDWQRGVLMHFEEERAILAQLQHPNIVRILDGGQTDAGLPYLVMDFIDGVDLMRHCRESGLDLVARIRLFCQVCEAVQEAHRHLIVHRDLKPSNVLVDQRGVPHLLDFGIAKLLDPLHSAAAGSGDQAQITVLGAMTPAYASPEQLRRKPLTTRSDIYSLGVILFQLIAGKRPYDTDLLSPAELERVVCTTAPPSLAVALHDVDAEPGYPKVPSKVDQDLERIVAKTLHKEAERRYGSAQELADDLQRYLAGQPVLAQPDSFGYRMRRFIGRNRFASALASIAVVLILAASGLALVQAHKARLAAETSDQINTFLLAVLLQSNVDFTGAEASIGDILEAAGEEVEGRFDDRPAIASGIRHAIGASLLNLNRLDAADQQLDRALEQARTAYGPHHGKVWEILDNLAMLRLAQGRYSEGADLLREVLDGMRHENRTGEHFYVTTNSNLGYIHIEQGEYVEAGPYFEEALAAVEERGVEVQEDDYANLLNNKAQVLHEIGQLDLAEALYLQAEEILRRTSPEGSRDLAILLNNRSSLAMEVKQGDKALALMRESVQMRKDSYRRDHPVVAFGYTNLSVLALSLRDVELALEAAEEAVAMTQRLSDSSGDQEVLALTALANARAENGDMPGAEAALEEARGASARMPEESKRARELIDRLTRKFANPPG